MAVKDYDVAAAFQAIEYELINSFFRNMKKHKVEEVKEQKEWEMWQVKQLQELDLYKKHNAEKYGTKFTDINKTIAEMIRLSNEEGQMDQEAEILSAMEKGLKPRRAPEQVTAQFFRTNERKLDTLINATVSDMEKAEVAVLRKADDVYRKTIFNAMVYANTGAGTYEKAVDMATKDFMKAGLTCVEYKNGSKHTISDYADMAVRTANKRAYLQGEGAKRQEWGIHTVIVNKRLRACPHCMPFAGKVFIDDVWGGGTAADGDYPLLSEAVAAGLYHPRCKDSHTAYFPGITDKPKKYTKEEVKEAEKAEEQERKADYAERQAESYQRLADTRLDPENKRQAQEREDRWKDFEGWKRDKRILKSKSAQLNKPNDADTMTVEDTLLDSIINLESNSIIDRKALGEEILEEYGVSGVPVNIADIPAFGRCNYDVKDGKLIIKDYNLLKNDPRGIKYQIKTAFHEAYHASGNGRPTDCKILHDILWSDIEETFAETSAIYKMSKYGITGLTPSYPDKLVKMLPRLKQLKEFRDCKTLTDFGKVAYEERINGGGSTWGDISKRAMRKRFTYSTYVQQYFTGIREDVDGIVDKVLENLPHLLPDKEKMIDQLPRIMERVENDMILTKYESMLINNAVAIEMGRRGVL